MKGQYRVVTEVMIFAIGVAITSYVVLSFSNVHDVATDLSLKDNMNGVANLVANAMIKSSINENSTIRLSIPDKISNYVYTITITGDEILIRSVEKPDIYVTKQLFNMSQNYIISGETVSSAKFIEIRLVGNELRLKRSVR